MEKMEFELLKRRKKKKTLEAVAIVE